MMKMENLWFYLQLAGIIGLGVMSFTSENQRHKEAMRRIKLEAENLRLEIELDELNDDYAKLKDKYDQTLDDMASWSDLD